MSLFSIFKVALDLADDSSLSEPAGHAAAAVTQVKDVKSFVSKFTVAPGAAQTQIDFSTTLTTGYRWLLVSDYPIMVRVNGNTATQQTMTSGNVSATNIGAPLPYNCFLCGTTQLTSLYVQPIAGATTTANCKLLIAGDPTNAYT